MRKTVIVASVFVVASMAMPSMAHAKDKPEPPFGSHSHIGKCKGHIGNLDLSPQHRDGQPARTKQNKGLNNEALTTEAIIRCR